MKTNLNIIKIIFIAMVMFTTTVYSYTWVKDVCQLVGCDGCKDIKDDIEDAADEIDDRHKELEKNVKEKYKKEVIPKLTVITKIQNKMMYSVAHIAALEQEANLDNKKLLFMLKQNQKLNTLGLGK